jgi:hypothetical protein
MRLHEGAWSSDEVLYGLAAAVATTLISLLSPNWHILLAVSVGFMGTRWALGAVAQSNSVFGLIAVCHLAGALALARLGPVPTDWPADSTIQRRVRHRSLVYLSNLAAAIGTILLLAFLVQVAFIVMGSLNSFNPRELVPLTMIALIASIVLSWMSDLKPLFRGSAIGLVLWFLALIALAGLGY